MLTVRSAATVESTSPASADSTVQAKVSRSGALPSVVGADTVTHSESPTSLLQEDRARLVHGDPQILDLVEGEVQPCREAGRGRPQHRQIRPRRGQPDLDEVLRPGLACDLGHPHLQGGTQWFCGFAATLSRSAP
jgi:hypothetical protein